MATPQKFIKDLATLFYTEFWPTYEYQDESLWDTELWSTFGSWLFRTRTASGEHVTLDATEMAVFEGHPTIERIEERIGQISKAAYDAGRFNNRNQFATYMLDNGCVVRFG